MQVHFGLGGLRAEWPRAVACVGTFDGVHLGHRAVIGAAVKEARNRDLPCALVTFDRHPNAVLAPERLPQSLSTLDQNLEMFSALGVTIAVILPFDVELSRRTASEFLQGILIDRLRTCAVVVGHDFAMGHDREGDPRWLAERIATTIVPPFELDGHRVSSSEIRQHVREGSMETASRLLGRHFELSGVVVQGNRLGREIGYPTANIARSADQVVPADGVYAGSFACQAGRFVAAISIGVRPAVGGTDRTVEAYLLDYGGGSLYGLSCRLAVTRRIREERNFASLEDLAKQIEDDVQQVRTSTTSISI